MRKHAFTICFMVGVTFVYISIISGIHLLTAETVARNKLLFQQRAVLTALGIEIPGSPVELVELYEQLVEEEPAPDGTTAYFRVRLPDSPEADPAYAMVVREYGPGLWGTITALVGFEPDGKRYRGVVFLDHSETPGLGARIDEPWFRDQFAGAEGPYTQLGGEPQDKGQAGSRPGTIDQITGATASSRAVMEIMNKSAARAGAFAGD